MSDSEKMGRCRRELDAAYRATRYKPEDSDVVIADAIDRLAEDVAEIKAKTSDIEWEAVQHFVESEKAWVKLVEDQRDAAIRERDQWREEARLAVINRDEARAEVERLRAELDDREQTEQVERMREENEILHRASLNYIHDRDQYRRERDEARAEVERLKAIVHSDAGHMARILIENERLRAAPAAPQPAGHGISPKVADTQSTGNAAPAPGWLTEEERGAVAFAAASFRGHAIAGNLKAIADQLDAILASAGSPPVVEVPVMGFLGDMTGREQGIVLAYRDALDAAGVPWKEKGVPRE